LTINSKNDNLYSSRIYVNNQAMEGEVYRKVREILAFTSII